MLPVPAGVGVLASASSFSNVTTGVSNMMSIVTSLMDAIVGDPILCTLFVSSFIGIAIGIIRGMKSV